MRDLVRKRPELLATRVRPATTGSVGHPPAVWWLLCCSAALLLPAACSLSPPPAPIPAAVAEVPRTPVVFVPGSTGSRLRDYRTGRVVWGNGGNLVGPLDGGRAIAVPIAPATGENDTIQAGTVVDRIRLAGVITKEIYRPLLRWLTAHGYRLGDLDDPAAGDTLFPFAYDWRQDTVRSSQRLLQGLQLLRRARGEQRLRVTFLCQSSGVNLCRYLVKYGGCSSEEAAAGAACSPAGIDVAKVILVAPSSGGSLRTLRIFLRGRRYLQPCFRKWRPETIFTFAGLYQDLPVYRHDLFVDGTGAPLDIDLFQASSWQRYGWSVYGEKARRRLARNRHPELFADAETRAAFLQRSLDNARRFHDLLQRDVPGFGDTRYYLIGSTDQETSARAVIVSSGGPEERWRTLFSDDRALRRRGDLLPVATADGDGHATRESQLWLSPQERAAMDGEPYLVPGEHFEAIVDPAVHRHLLVILRDEAE